MIRVLYERSRIFIESLLTLVFILFSYLSYSQSETYKIIDNVDIYNNSLIDTKEIDYIKENFSECFSKDEINEYFEVHLAWIQDSIEVVVNDITIFNERIIKHSPFAYILISDSVPRSSHNIFRIIFHDKQVVVNFSLKNDFKSILISPFLEEYLVDLKMSEEIDYNGMPLVVGEDVNISSSIKVYCKSFSYQNYMRILNRIKQGCP
jgi:hypothetical protein